MEQELIKETPTQVSWSMDDARLKEINRLLIETNEFFKQEHFNDALDILKTVRKNFEHKCNVEELKELDTMEKNMQMCSHAGSLASTRDLNNGNGWGDNTEYSNRQVEIYDGIIKKHFNKLEPRVKAYYSKVMKLLDDKGFLQKDRKDKTDMNY